MATTAKTTTGRTAPGTGGSTASQSRRGIESAVDVPVGTALTLKDRVDELVRPWRSIDSATSEVKSIRKRFDRELSKAERRGGTARRKLTKRTEDRFREARARVGERVPTL